MTPHEISVICRFSRNGVIPWQSVAVMLGRDRASLKAEYDSLSMTPVTLDPPNIGPIEALPEPECYRSTKDRGPGLRMEILGALIRRRRSAADLVSITCATISGVQSTLSRMKADAIVSNDGRMPATWAVTEFGREIWRREREDEERAARPFDTARLPGQESEHGPRQHRDLVHLADRRAHHVRHAHGVAMTDPLRIKRANTKGHTLTVSKTGERYDVRISGGPNITAEELSQIEAYIGDDPDGAATLEKLRNRASA